MSSERKIQNIALTGFMGVGKSTIGRHLADLMGFEFIDTDERIESEAKCSIQEIFASQGEASFRKLEQQLVREMDQWSNHVISTGGGLVTFEDNLEKLKSYAFIVCLWASPATIYDRISRQSHRPLLQTEDPLSTITKLLDQRKQAYQSADLMINTEVRPMRQITQIIIRSFRAAKNRTRHSMGSPRVNAQAKVGPSSPAKPSNQ